MAGIATKPRRSNSLKTKEYLGDIVRTLQVASRPQKMRTTRKRNNNKTNALGSGVSGHTSSICTDTMSSLNYDYSQNNLKLCSRDQSKERDASPSLISSIQRFRSIRGKVRDTSTKPKQESKAEKSIYSIDQILTDLRASTKTLERILGNQSDKHHKM